MATMMHLNARAKRLTDTMVDRAAELNIAVHSVGGAQVIDAGVKTIGSIEAGLMLARICLADHATVQLTHHAIAELPLPGVLVDVRHLVPACMASQYAGWQIAQGKFFAIGSGPMRAAYGKEDLFDHIGFREQPEHAVGVLETGTLPDEAIITLIAGKCRVAPANLTLLCARTASLAGSAQIVARSVETALHKLHTLKFDLSRIVAGVGVAPLPPVTKDDLAGIGRTNDAILYGSTVTLMMTGDDESMLTIGKQLPSGSSPDFGEPFARIFERYQRDFYKIDPMLFSPARVCLQNLTTGICQTFGQLEPAILQQSFLS